MRIGESKAIHIKSTVGVDIPVKTKGTPDEVPKQFAVKLKMPPGTIIKILEDSKQAFSSEIKSSNSTNSDAQLIAVDRFVSFVKDYLKNQSGRKNV